MSLIEIREAVDSDQNHLVEWLQQPGVLKWFPLYDLREIEDAARIWMSYSKQHAVLTALYDKQPCGIANFYLQPYKKLAHQCLFAIIVDEKYRGKGVGTHLLTELLRRGKELFALEFVHLEVYEGNPAIHLYRKLGFVEYGKQNRFVKEDGRYLAKVLMQKIL